MTLHEAEKIRMPFGHYQDFTLGVMAARDPLYLDYVASRYVADSYLREALAVLAAEYRDTIAAKRAAGEKPALFDMTPSAEPATKAQQLKLF